MPEAGSHAEGGVMLHYPYEVRAAGSASRTWGGERWKTDRRAPLSDRTAKKTARLSARGGQVKTDSEAEPCAQGLC
jgi:hypothetical protein